MPIDKIANRSGGQFKEKEVFCKTDAQCIDKGGQSQDPPFKAPLKTSKIPFTLKMYELEFLGA